jgi:hypothetical protein
MSLSLALPNTENKWRLRFQSDDDEENEENEGTEGTSGTNLVENVGDSTFTTALGLLLKASDKVDIRFDAGIKFYTPVDPFTRFRVRRSFKFEKVELRFTETLEWRDSEGKSAENKFQFEYPFTANYFFRSGTRATYWDVNSYWSGSQSFTFFNQRSQKSVIAYSIGISGQNEDDLHLRKKDQVNEYWIETSYRKNFYQNWLFYQIKPGISYPREFDFDPLPRIEFKVEAVYGYGKL